MSDTFLSTRDVVRAIGLSRQEVWRKRRAGQFPHPVQLTSRRVGYSAAEIDAWMIARKAERDAAIAARKQVLQ